MRTVLRRDHPRSEATDQDTRLLVRRPGDAEFHDRADQAAARVAPHLVALTTSTPPPVPPGPGRPARCSEAGTPDALAIISCKLPPASSTLTDRPMLPRPRWPSVPG